MGVGDGQRGRLDGKVAVVTGGANGIGRACCLRFAEEGADVVVADLLEGPGAEVVAAVEARGRRAIFAASDVASPEDNETMMQRALDELGGLDVVATVAGISNAGYRSTPDISEQLEAYTSRPATMTAADVFLATPLAAWREVLDVNLTGTFLAIQAAATRMRERGTRGSIITMSSIGAKTPEAGTLPPYGVSKAGVWMLTKFASTALAPVGIRVNAIGPGLIDTNMSAFAKAIPGLLERSLQRVPMARMGTPEEVAGTALFLASDESSYTTGEMFHVDGGYYTE